MATSTSAVTLGVSFSMDTYGLELTFDAYVPSVASLGYSDDTHGYTEDDYGIIDKERIYGGS